MQAVSGSRAAQTFGIGTVSDINARIAQFSASQNFDLFGNTTANLASTAITIPPYPAKNLESLHYSIKNQVRYNSSVALQFTYQAADCRLWVSAKKNLLSTYLSIYLSHH